MCQLIEYFGIWKSSFWKYQTRYCQIWFSLKIFPYGSSPEAVLSAAQFNGTTDQTMFFFFPLPLLVGINAIIERDLNTVCFFFRFFLNWTSTQNRQYISHCYGKVRLLNDNYGLGVSRARSECSIAIKKSIFHKKRVGGRWVTCAWLKIWYKTGSLVGKWDPCVCTCVNITKPVLFCWNLRM